MVIYLFKGTNIFSKLIQWQSRSCYSHAALGDGTHVWESVRTGVRMVTVKEMENHYAHTRPSTHFDQFTVAMTAEQEEHVKAFLGRQVGKPYDLSMVIRFLTRQQETRESKGKWFCSELVAAALGKAVPVLARIEPWAVSPGMLSYSPLLVKVP